MAGIVANTFGKALVTGVRLTSYGLGLTAAQKMSVLGMRGVSYFTSSYTQDGFGKQVVDTAKNIGINPLRKEDTTSNHSQLIKEIIALTILAAVIHDAAFYIEGPAPKIYNTLLTATPVRVLNTSILDAIKETIRSFDVKALFVNN